MKAGSLTVQTGYVVDFEPEYPVYCSSRGGSALVSHQAAEAALPGLMRDTRGRCRGLLCNTVKSVPVIQCLPVVYNCDGMGSSQNLARETSAATAAAPADPVKRGRYRYRTRTSFFGPSTSTKRTYS